MDMDWQSTADGEDQPPLIFHHTRQHQTENKQLLSLQNLTGYVIGPGRYLLDNGTTVYNRVKRHISGIFTRSSTPPTRPSRHSPPQSQIFRQNPPSPTGYASTTPVTKRTYQTPHSTGSSKYPQRDQAVRFIPFNGTGSQSDPHIPEISPHPQPHGTGSPSNPTTSVAIDYVRQHLDSEGDTDMVDAHLDTSPRERKIRRMPGAYPDSPVVPPNEWMIPRMEVESGNDSAEEVNMNTTPSLWNIPIKDLSPAASSPVTPLNVRKRKYLSLNQKLAIKENWQAHYRANYAPIRTIKTPTKSCLRNGSLISLPRKYVNIYESPTTGLPITKRKRYDDEKPTMWSMLFTPPKSRSTSNGDCTSNEASQGALPQITTKMAGESLVKSASQQTPADITAMTVWEDDENSQHIPNELTSSGMDPQTPRQPWQAVDPGVDVASAGAEMEQPASHQPVPSDIGTPASKPEFQMERAPCTPMTDDQAAAEQLQNEMRQSLQTAKQHDIRPIKVQHEGGHQQPAAKANAPAKDEVNKETDKKLVTLDFPEAMELANIATAGSSTAESREVGQNGSQEEDKATPEEREKLSSGSDKDSKRSSRSSSRDLTASVGKLLIGFELPESPKSSARRSSGRAVSRAKKEAELQREIEREEAEARQQAKREADERAVLAGERLWPKQNIIQPLPAGADELIGKAMEKQSDDEVASYGGRRNKVTRKDIGKVVPQTGTNDDPNGWLNDVMIAAYLQLIADHEHEKMGMKLHAPPKLHAFNSFFYTNLQSKGYKPLAKWATKAKFGGKALLNMRHIFVPVNQTGNHWTIAIISPQQRTIEYFDSFHGRSKWVIENLKKYLEAELGSAYVESEWKVREQEGFKGRGGGPDQYNASDCGVFAVTTAKMVALGANPMAYTARDMALQRRRIVAEVINGGFTGDYAPKFEWQ